jgi:hypothetical protein
MHRLYTALVRSKLEYASVAWNSITSTDANKLERIQQRFATLCFNRFFPQVRYNYSLVLEELKLHTLYIRRHRLDASFLLKFTLVWNSALPFWKLLVSEFLLGISETLHCSMSAPHVKIIPLLDVHQPLMLFAGTLTYSGPETFSSVVFYNKS